MRKSSESALASEDLRMTIRAAQLGLSKEVVLVKIEERSAAKAAKNFAEADRIRDELLANGVVLKDGPDGTKWEVKR